MRLHRRYRVGQFETALFDANLAALSVGKMTAAAFLTATGLTFTRSSTSTVQTSLNALLAGVAVNEVCIGNAGYGIGAVVQQNVRQLLSGGTGTSPRQIEAAAGWGIGTSSEIYPHTDSPDGSGTGCTQINAQAGEYSPYGAGGAANQCFSSWQVGNNATHNDSIQQVWNDGTPASGIVTNDTHAHVWERYVTLSGAVGRAFYAAVDSRDYSAVGGQAAQHRILHVDYAQLEAGNWASEAIPTALARRRPDRFGVSAAGKIGTGGVVNFYAKFIPKFNSTDLVYYNATDILGGAQAQQYFLTRTDGNVTIYQDAVTKKLVVAINGAPAATTNVMTFLRGEIVELQIRAGGGATSIAKYRRNGGAWVNLGLANFAGVVAAAGTFGFFNAVNLADDTNTLSFPAWIQRIMFLPATTDVT